jgi:phosphate acetyltransferase
MELLTRHVDKVGIFRPLLHPPADHVLDLLRSRYRIDIPVADMIGMSYDEAAALQAEAGLDELVSRLVDRYRALERECQTVLVLGTDFHETNIPDELAFNARLANEFGSLVLPVVGGHRESADQVVAEVRNAYRAFTDLGCSVLAMIANRVEGRDKQDVQRRLTRTSSVPVYVIPDDPALSAPTVAQVVDATGAEVLLGDASGLARDVRRFVFGGAMLPNLLDALSDGSLMVTPGDRADLLIGALAAHAAGSPPLAGVLLTLGLRPDENVLGLAARCSLPRRASSPPRPSCPPWRAGSAAPTRGRPRPPSASSNSTSTPRS